MPKSMQLDKCKHPNSRRTKALAKQIKKQNSREKSKLSNIIKCNLLSEKIMWFRDNLLPQMKNYSPNQLDELILKYFTRFDDELNQIKIKHSIGNRKNRQHASREDIINLTIKREKEEYETCGIEIPNLLDPIQFQLVKNWNGETRLLQNFKIRRFSKRYLEDEKKKLEKTVKKSSSISEKVEISQQKSLNSSKECVDTSNNETMDVDR